jgi:hypothetical protein
MLCDPPLPGQALRGQASFAEGQQEVYVKVAKTPSTASGTLEEVWPSQALVEELL